MFRRMAAGALVCGLAALAAACSKSTPTTPSTNTTTETFTGTLTPNAANTHVFVVAAAGNITATLTAIGPDATQPIGFSMGTYSALTGVCTIVMSNGAATQGFQLTGQAATQGSYCMRIFDNGSVAAMQTAGTISSSNPFTYTITVAHP